ncbi:DMT family transporter [Blastomonas sp.]|uniref:DMT family transporter n=1 Tax=Blastomonas sp. TaxID=1909299 RepID=UPI0035944E38
MQHDSLLDAPAERGFGRLDWSIAIAMMLLWGFNIIAMKSVVDAAGALPGALLRQAIVALACLPFLRIVPGKMRLIVLLGVLSGGAFYVAIGLSLALATNISALAIAGQLGVPFSLILAVIFLKEKIGIPRLIGIILALFGVLLLVFDPEAGRELPALAISACGSMVWAIATLIQRNLGGIGVLNITGWLGLIGSLVILPFAVLIEPEGVAMLTSLSAETYAWTAYAAIGSSIGGHGAMVWLLQRHPISTVSPLTIPTPVISVCFATWWFGTPLSWLMIAGGLIALVGVSIVAIRNAQRSRALAEARLLREGTRA